MSFVGFAVGAPTAINAVGWTVIALTRLPLVDPRSLPVPSECWLDSVQVQLNTIVAPATQCECKLTHDLVGDAPLGITSGMIALVLGEADPTDAGVLFTFDGYYRTRADSVGDTIYCWLRLNGGTANATPRLYYRTL